ncbi:hypothetical protein [Nocardiopsis sp. MG754419]|uniref:hypothetical protein n=1 Tax=Nocardiopsis sp. MG754419 TaxID=2259865 RepID=UPI001BACFB6A|nr:hypothetical protein [Nocardiopsis sp. MG754419]MBR8744676.1 hypothetical protein [Nocardiopsis sp. MG754419]
MSTAPLSPLPRPVTGVFVRQVIRAGCGGDFAAVWLDAEPPQEGSTAVEGLEFVDDLPGAYYTPDSHYEPVFTKAFFRGFREHWLGPGPGRARHSARIVLRDAHWSDVDSGPYGFAQAGRVAAREVMDCVREDRAPRQAGRPAHPDRPIPLMPRLRGR